MSIDMSSGIALITAADGRILSIIRDDVGLPAPLPGGTTVMDLMEENSIAEARSFLSTLNDRGGVFDWGLTIELEGQAIPMRFAGTAEAGRLFLVAARSGHALSRFAEELMAINNEQTNALRSALKEFTLQNRPEPRNDSELYEDLSRVNNELANLQREMAKKNVELERLNEQKNRILGVAAHDLRNPLGVIRSYSEFLEEEAWDVLNDEQREFVLSIKEISEFTLGLVTDLLDVSAIEAGQLRLNLEPTDLSWFLRRNVTLNRVLATRKRIDVDIDPVPEMPPILFDRGKMEQVLNNLISNAVKFSHPESKVRIRLAVADDFVTLAVHDQGQGIPAKDLPNLFAPFSKVSVKSTAGEQSTGLGLAIVRNIIEGHGGRIWVESEVGVGSTFFFTLPVVR